MKRFWSWVRRWLRFNWLYLGRPPWDTGISPPELKAFLARTKPGRALDVGCGTGTNLVTMAQSGWQVVGVDFAWVSVLKARAKLKQHGFEGRVLHGDITRNLALDGQFNLILDIGCYHGLSISGREDYRDHLREWLAPGGTLLLYAHRQESPDQSYGWTEEDLHAFQSFLDLVWQDDGDEARPDGGGGFPATWLRFDYREKGPG